MKITVLGAGAIGCLVAGYLKEKGEEVSLVGHKISVKAIEEKGLHISGIRGNFDIKIQAQDRLSCRPDLIILATKTQDIEIALKENKKLIQNALILTTQNGIQAEDIVAKYIPPDKIISSIVMFGVTYLEPAKIVHNFEGSWIIGRIFDKNDETVIGISQILDKIFPTLVSEDIRGMKYLKIFVNANNAIPAILGISMQEAFSDIQISCISIAIWKEGLLAVNRAGIKLVSLPDFSLERLTKLTALPTLPAAKIFSSIMTGLSKEPLFGSILQSIKRGRTSEIDYINGEFVRIAEKNNIRAALNERLVQMVHEVEKANKFFSKQDLVNNTKELFK